jgi:ABC-type multidrug transport system permease subunit
MNILKQILIDRLSDYKIIDIILKIWLIALIILFLVGFLVIVSGILTGQVDTDNVTFGIFDTLG